jgi:hypothetical protein
MSCDYELSVDRGHVLQGLQTFRVPRKVKPRDRAILGFDGSYLTVEAFDQMFVARATGSLPGNAHVGATLFEARTKAAIGEYFATATGREQLASRRPRRSGRQRDPAGSG